MVRTYGTQTIAWEQGEPAGFRPLGRIMGNKPRKARTP